MSSAPQVDSIICQEVIGERRYTLIPAFNEFPITNVVHPAYHAAPNGGQGSFLPSAKRRFNCVRVFATKVSPRQPLSSPLKASPSLCLVCLVSTIHPRKSWSAE